MKAGLMQALKGMKVGGTRTVIIPGWFNNLGDYKTEKEFMDNLTGVDAIYTITLKDLSPNIMKWEVSELEKYVKNNMAGVDSSMYGIYYHTLVQPVDTATIKRDSTIYINYIGRLLDGSVFDTSIADTAKFYGIYSASRSYGAQKIKLAEDYKEIEFGDGNAVTGFSYALSKLRRFEVARCGFISNYGYGTKGSSPSIPPYAPLVFDLFVVDKPE